MFKTPRRRDAAFEALTGAIMTIARSEDIASGDRSARSDEVGRFAAPLLITTRAERTPLAVVALQLAERRDRAVIAATAELRGRLPRFEFAVGLPGEMCNGYPGYEAWLPLEGGGLWLVSPFTPHPAVPIFRLASDGLCQLTSPPWSSEQDRALGLRHATVTLARFIGGAA